jgi:hypothetical protein
MTVTSCVRLDQRANLSKTRFVDGFETKRGGTVHLFEDAQLPHIFVQFVGLHLKSTIQQCSVR